MKRIDFACEIVGLMREVGGVDPAAACKVEIELRRRYGGKVLQIERRPVVTIDDVNSALRQRKPVRVIAAETGLSRSTIYRMLGTKSLKRPAPETN